MGKNWSPISFDEIQELINMEERELDLIQYRLWDSIKINLIKWNDGFYGNEGEGFWVAGIIGSRVLWYNDIEEGWNISSWTQIGIINDYLCNQDTLKRALYKIRYVIDEQKI